MSKLEAKVIHNNKSLPSIKESDFETFYPNFERLIQKLSYIVGLDKPLEKIEITLLANHVFNFHDNFNIMEIEYAFQLNEAGKYEKKISHYQLFTCSYISDILKLYQEFRSKTIINFEKMIDLEKNKELNVNHTKMTNQEAFELLVEFYQKDKEVPLYGPYKLAFQHLKDNDLVIVDWTLFKKTNQNSIKRIFDLTKDELELQYQKLYVKLYITDKYEVQ